MILDQIFRSDFVDPFLLPIEIYLNFLPLALTSEFFDLFHSVIMEVVFVILTSYDIFTPLTTVIFDKTRFKSIFVLQFTL